MKTKVGKYTLYSDSMSMWIVEDYETIDQKTKKPTGKIEQRRVAGYSTSLKNLLRSFRDAKVGGSDAESLEELIEVLTAVYEDMAELNDAAVKHGLQKLKEMSK